MRQVLFFSIFYWPAIAGRELWQAFKYKVPFFGCEKEGDTDKLYLEEDPGTEKRGAGAATGAAEVAAPICSQHPTPQTTEATPRDYF